MYHPSLGVWGSSPPALTPVAPNSPAPGVPKHRQRALAPWLSVEDHGLFFHCSGGHQCFPDFKGKSWKIYFGNPFSILWGQKTMLSSIFVPFNTLNTVTIHGPPIPSSFRQSFGVWSVHDSREARVAWAMDLPRFHSLENARYARCFSFPMFFCVFWEGYIMI